MSELTELLSKATSQLERKLYFLGWLNKRLKEAGAKDFPVLVGGSAVALYTAGNYATQDIDLTYGLIERIGGILLPEGFYKSGRYWVNEKLDLLVECPGSTYPKRITQVVIDDLVVYVSSVEDMIIDRLCALVFWNSSSDGEWARTLLETSEVDWDYLRKRALEEDVAERLDEIAREIERDERDEDD